MSETVKIKVGLCPTHGIVKDDDVIIEFPNKAECALCGTELDQAGYSEIPQDHSEIETNQGKA